MDAQTIARCTGARLDRAQRFAEALSASMIEYGIDTRARQAMFLSNVGHESGGLHYTVELWGPTEAQRRYEGRRDLGNLQLGDGFRFRGRGLLQTTGRANYKALSDRLGVDYVADPERLGNTDDAARSACFFWQSKNLNLYADAGDFREVCRRINGGFNGLAERIALHDAAKAALGVEA